MNKTFATGVSAEESRERAERGTSLLELMVAISVFFVISAAAFSLLNQQQTSSIGVRGRAGLNMALRNTVSMLQMDLANAGSNYYQATNMSIGDLGVTVINNVVPATSSSGCYTAATGSQTLGTYGSNCFDQLNVISVDSGYPIVQATDTSGSTTGTPGTHCSVPSSGTAYAQAGTLPNGTALTLAQTATYYHVNDQLLFLVNGTGSYAKYTSVVLTGVSLYPNSTSPVAVKFTFAPTNSNGSNTLYNDPLNITACSSYTTTSATCPPSAAEVTPGYSFLADQFCAGATAGAGDWILKLNPIIYQVNTSATDYAGNQNPTLTRTSTVNGVTTTATVMEQVIGFKVGASVVNDPTGTADVTNYTYDASCYTQYLLSGACPSTVLGANAYNFTILDSVRVSLIGRTTPVYTKNYTFRNTFDNGPYEVQGTAVVVNPRNLSFNTN